MDRKPTVQFAINEEVNLKFLFNDPIKSGTNSKGNWHMYTVENDNVEQIMFATDTLNQILIASGPLRGKTLSIKKVVRDVSGKNVTMFTVNGKSLDDIKHKEFYKSDGLKKFMDSSPTERSAIDDDSILGLVNQIKTLSDAIVKKARIENSEKLTKLSEEEPNEFDRHIPKDDSDDLEDIPF